MERLIHVINGEHATPTFRGWDRVFRYACSGNGCRQCTDRFECFTLGPDEALKIRIESPTISGIRAKLANRLHSKPWREGTKHYKRVRRKLYENVAQKQNPQNQSNPSSP